MRLNCSTITPAATEGDAVDLDLATALLWLRTFTFTNGTAGVLITPLHKQ
jgi:hypothetical protein